MDAKCYSEFAKLMVALGEVFDKPITRVFENCQNKQKGLLLSV
jgi:hypothetical protein